MEPNSGTSRANELAGSLGRWLIFSAGVAALVAALILPAQIDLRNTRIERDRALHIEQTNQARIERYQSFLHELDHPSDATVDLLAMSQLGMIPDSRDALIVPGQPADPQLFEFLEPASTAFVLPKNNISRLEALTTGTESRFWFVLIGAVAIMYGLLPAAKSHTSPSTLVA